MKPDIRWQLLLASTGLLLVLMLLSYQVQSAALCTVTVPATIKSLAQLEETIRCLQAIQREVGLYDELEIVVHQFGRLFFGGGCVFFDGFVDVRPSDHVPSRAVRGYPDESFVLMLGMGGYPSVEVSVEPRLRFGEADFFDGFFRGLGKSREGEEEGEGKRQEVFHVVCQILVKGKGGFLGQDMLQSAHHQVFHQHGAFRAECHEVQPRRELRKVDC